MRVSAIVLCVASVLPLGAFAGQQSAKKLGQNEASTMRQEKATSKQNAPKDLPAAQGQLSSADMMFLKALIQEDTSEISLAKMALQKSSNADVRQYAQTKILGADPQMRDGAVKLARENGMAPPSKTNPRQVVMYDKLSKKSGELFDSAYMTYEADQQTNDVKLVNAELNSTKNAAVKSYVEQEKTPVVQAASSAKQISEKLAGELRSHRQPDGAKH